MNGFGLLLGHLVGDYILQNDWMASNKTNPHPGKNHWPKGPPKLGDGTVCEWIDYDCRRERWRTGHVACAVHCTLYTLAVWAFSWQWMPWWGLLACWALHFPVDRFRLASLWMRKVSGQTQFANGALAPWSVILVDNVYHLLCLYLIGVIAQ